MKSFSCFRSRAVLLLAVSCLILPAVSAVAQAQSNVGRRFPSEKKTYNDPVTQLPIAVLTSDPANDAKPYQTHTTWTADGKWILFRSDRGGSGSQAFIVNETNGDIIQLTDGPGTGTGSLNLARKSMRLYFFRGGPQMGPRAAAAATAPAQPDAPRQLIELNLDTLIADSMAGKLKASASYERVVATVPSDLRDAGGFALDADETVAYWGVSWGPVPTPPPTAATGSDAAKPKLDQQNTDPTQSRDASRLRFEAMGKGPGGIRKIDLKTGAISTVIDVDFRMGHVQTNPWVPGEIIYCHETTGDGPQRMWTVRGDGTGNRPLYAETPDEWITHETVAGPDEVMFNIMGHLPYLRERPTGIAVINLRTNNMKILGQMEEDMGQGRLGGYWHCNGSPDGRWAVGDNFSGQIFVINRTTGKQTLLTTDHKMKPDHTHPIFSPDSKRVAIQSGHLSDGKSLDLMVVALPEKLLSTE